MSGRDPRVVVGLLTRAEKEMMRGRHTEAGNPWPFIGIRQRAGGAKHRMFQGLIALQLYDRSNCITPFGSEVRKILTGEE